jgi:hypothetical protein
VLYWFSATLFFRPSGHKPTNADDRFEVICLDNRTPPPADAAAGGLKGCLAGFHHFQFFGFQAANGSAASETNLTSAKQRSTSTTVDRVANAGHAYRRRLNEYRQSVEPLTLSSVVAPEDGARAQEPMPAMMPYGRARLTASSFMPTATAEQHGAMATNVMGAYANDLTLCSRSIPNKPPNRTASDQAKRR